MQTEILIFIGWVNFLIFFIETLLPIYCCLEGGASQNPCSETYAGPSPFSEPETVALSNFIGSLGHEIDIYLAFHSYGHYILYPYGHTIEPADNVEHLVSEIWLKLILFYKK